jgi:endoglucanase
MRGPTPLQFNLGVLLLWAVIDCSSTNGSSVGADGPQATGDASTSGDAGDGGVIDRGFAQDGGAQSGDAVSDASTDNGWVLDGSVNDVGQEGGVPKGGDATADSASGDMVNAVAMATAMGFGANIGNTFDNTTSWETGWGEPLVTQTYIDGMANHGIKTVRVPVAWDTYAVNGVIDATKMNRVKEVVGFIEAAGMYSIVNIHWDGGWIDNENNSNKYKLTDDVKTKFASYWSQISTALSSVGNSLIYEGLNEEGQFYVNGDPNGTPDYAALNTLNQLFVTTVRAQTGYNKTRALLIAGFATDIAKTCVDAFTVPDDPAGQGKLFLSLHYYTPYTFTGLDSVATWGSPQTTWGTSTDKATLQGLFDEAGSFSRQRKIPVIVGEFAVTPGANYPRDPASRILWMDSVAKAAFSYGMVPVLWDTGSEINRTDGSFSTALQSVFKDLNL